MALAALRVYRPSPPETSLTEEEMIARGAALAGVPVPPSTEVAMPGLTEGRIVHYVLEDGPNAGEHRPAIIVKVWANTYPYSVQLQVFTDGKNDSAWDGQRWTNPEYVTGIAWKTSRSHSDAHLPGTWHWIERA